MYHDFVGREIEDLEMENMQRDSVKCIECGGYSKGACDGCQNTLCVECNEAMNEQYGNKGDGLCFNCRDAL